MLLVRGGSKPSGRSGAIIGRWDNNSCGVDEVWLANQVSIGELRTEPKNYRQNGEDLRKFR